LNHCWMRLENEWERIEGPAAGMCAPGTGKKYDTGKKRRADNVRSAALSPYLLHLIKKIDCMEDQMM